MILVMFDRFIIELLSSISGIVVLVYKKVLFTWMVNICINGL